MRFGASAKAGRVAVIAGKGQRATAGQVARQRKKDTTACGSRTGVEVAGWPRRHAALTNVSEPLGLYIHIPFRSAICHYCNFNRDPARPRR